MYTIKKLLIFFFAALGLLLSAHLANAGEKKPKTYHVYEDVSLVPTTRFFYYKPRIVVKALTPHIESDIDDENIDRFNELTTALIKDEIANYRKEVGDALPDLSSFPASDIKNDLNIDFDTSVVNGDGSPTLSVRFTVQYYIAGMANPYEYHRVITYDLYNGQELHLEDFFKLEADYLSVLAEYSKNTLAKHSKYKEIFLEGANPTQENYKNWNITPHGFLITFDKGQVAPRVYGSQTVLVPYSRLKEILAEDTPVSACLIHKTKCYRNSLYTGGFIDEASLKSARNPILAWLQF